MKGMVKLFIPIFFLSLLNSNVKGQVSVGTCTDLGTIKIAIPASLTAHARSLSFGLELQPLNCEHKRRIELVAVPLTGNAENSTGAKFYKDGTLLIRNSYYAPSDYCIQSVEEDGMAVEVCPHPCGGDHDSVCAPKCCDLDKVLDGFKGGCQFSDLRWTPIIYDPKSSSPPVQNGGKALLPPDTPIRSQNSSLMDFKYENRKLSCRAEDIITWSLRNLTRFGFLNLQFRFLSNSSMMYFNNSQWNILETSFCIDGIQNYGMSLFYTGSLWDQIVQTCPNGLRKVTMVGASVQRVGNIAIPIAYGLVMLCSCILLSTTLIVYFLLRKNQKFHMWVVASYIISLILLNLLFGTSNILTQLGSTNERMTGTMPCILIGAATHLLIVSTFIWLTFINLNIWFTFRTLISSPSLSIQRHGIKRFLIFSIIAWGLPTLLVILGLILDHVNRMRGMDSLFSPGYGIGRCLISVRAEGVYLFYPIGVLLIFNATIFGYTICRISLYEEMTQQLNRENSNARQWRLIKIYTRLLITASVLWMTELIAWYFRWDTTIGYWILIDGLNLLQSILIFIIFVCRKKTWMDLEEKYPTVKRASMYFTLKRKSRMENQILISKSKNSSNDPH